METLKKLVSTPQGEQLIDLTAEEVAQRKIEEQQAIADQQAREQKIASELANKQSALTKTLRITSVLFNASFSFCSNSCFIINIFDI